MNTRIRGILFDLGDTLLDFGPVDRRSLFEAGGRLAYDYLVGLGQPVPSFAKFHRRQLRAIQWNYLKSRLTRREFNALDVLGRLGRSMGQRLSHPQLLELAWRWYQPLSEHGTVEEGLVELLKDFAGAGMVLGVVSNTFIPGPILDRHLAREKLLDALPVRIYSCDVKYRKPDPGIFRVAMKVSGLTPGETLFVGDSPHADIHGANQAGLISVLKDPDGRHHHAGFHPRHRITRLAELRAIVDRYRKG